MTSMKNPESHFAILLQLSEIEYVTVDDPKIYRTTVDEIYLRSITFLHIQVFEPTSLKQILMVIPYF